MRWNAQMDKYQAVIQSKYDEGLATLRELIKRSDDEAICQLIESLIEEMQTTSDHKDALIKAAALVGMLGAYLSRLAEEV